MSWIPRKWEEVVGNEAIVHYFRTALIAILAGLPFRRTAMLIGPSGSGKTVTAKLFAKCIICHHLDPETLNPCGKCYACGLGYEDSCQADLYSGMHGGPDRHYHEVDCTNLTVADLRNKIKEFHGMSFRLVLLDEVHRLESRSMDQMLLKPVRERGVEWIRTSAYKRLGHASMIYAGGSKTTG